MAWIASGWSSSGGGRLMACVVSPKSSSGGGGGGLPFMKAKGTWIAAVTINAANSRRPYMAFVSRFGFMSLDDGLCGVASFMLGHGSSRRLTSGTPCFFSMSVTRKMPRFLERASVMILVMVS